MVEGELVHREYERTIETDNGPVKVMWPIAEIAVDSVSVLDRKAKQEERGAAYFADPSDESSRRVPGDSDL